ncbi:MAG: YggT family protein [Bacillota bacterium]
MGIIIRAVDYFFNIYYLLIIAAVIFSWVRPMRGTFLYDLARITYQLTEPILSPIRRALPTMGGLDFSPIIALLLVQLVQRLVRGLLFQIAF